MCWIPSFIFVIHTSGIVYFNVCYLFIWYIWYGSALLSFMAVTYTIQSQVTYCNVLHIVQTHATFFNGYNVVFFLFFFFGKICGLYLAVVKQFNWFLMWQCKRTIQLYLSNVPRVLATGMKMGSLIVRMHCVSGLGPNFELPEPDFWQSQVLQEPPQTAGAWIIIIFSKKKEKRSKSLAF